MKRTAVALSVVVTLLLPAPPAGAQFAVIDVANLSANYSQLTQQIQQLVQLIQQLEAMYRNLEQITDPNWRDLLGFFQELNSLAQQGQALAYSLQGVFGAYRSTMPGFVAMEPGDFAPVYSGWVDITLDSLAASLDSVSAQAAEYEDTQIQLQELKLIANSAEGNLEALNAANMLLGHMAEETTKLNQVLAAIVQGQNVALGMELNVEAVGEASARELVNADVGAFPIYTGDGGYDGVPDDWPFPCLGCEE